MLCPICQNPTEETFRPFCSKRCQLVDLNNWFGEVYAIPVVENSNDEAGDGSELSGEQAADPALLFSVS